MRTIYCATYRSFSPAPLRGNADLPSAAIESSPYQANSSSIRKNINPASQHMCGTTHSR